MGFHKPNKSERLFFFLQRIVAAEPPRNGGGAGTVHPRQKFEETGRVDLIIFYNSWGRLPDAGPWLLSRLDAVWGRPNAIVMGMAKIEILYHCERPAQGGGVLAGVCGTDPFR